MLMFFSQKSLLSINALTSASGWRSGIITILPTWLLHRVRLAAVVGSVAAFATAALGQSGLAVGTPPTSWNGYLIGSDGPNGFYPSAKPTSPPIIGTTTIQTAPAGLSTDLSPLPIGFSSSPFITAGSDAGGNVYQLENLTGYNAGIYLGSQIISKTSNGNLVGYISLRQASYFDTLVQTRTEFLLTRSSNVYRFKNDGSLEVLISGPPNGVVGQPIIGADDTVMYPVRLPKQSGANENALYIFAPVSAVPYLQPALISLTSVPLAQIPALTLSTNVYSSLPISYQWSYNGLAVGGATQGSYTGPFLGTGTYALVATTSGGTVSTSTQVQLTVSGAAVGPAPKFLANPVGAKIVLGSSLALRVTAAATAPVSLQWTLNGIPIPGANTTTLSTVNYGAYDSTFTATQPGTYTVIASTAAPDGGTVTSSGATVEILTSTGVSVLPAPTILAQPSSVNALYANGAVTPTGLSVTAVATLPMSYQWLLDGTTILGATNVTYTATRPGTYSVAVSTTAGTVTSVGGTLKVVTSTGIPVLPAPTILSQPASVNALYVNGAVTPTALSVTAVATLPMSYQWLLDGTTILGATNVSYTATRPGIYSLSVSTTAGTVISQVAALTVVTSGGVTVTAAPTIFAQPQGAGVVFGGGSGLPTLTVSGVALKPIIYQWFLNGTLIPGANGPAYKAATAGSYTVTVTTSVGSVTSAPAVVSLVNRLANISGRCQVGTGANIGIAGFVVTSYNGAAKQFLIRGVGPGLGQFGLSGTLAQPVLSVFDSMGRAVATNAGWNGSPEIAAAGMAAGAFPLVAVSADAALVLNLTPGAYTAQIAGVGGATGVALIEVYEVLPDAGQLLNISERAFVGSGANILISGFVTTGSQPSIVLVRAIGPGLGPFGLSGALVQPILSIYDSRGALIGLNNGWSAGSNAEAIAINNAAAGAGAFLLQPGSGDCAVLLSLPPGAYTAQVSGVNGSTGVALVEVYQIP
jgi:hypothetical protein